ncbi:MAG TPA: hypothetical protein VH592_10475 [Gemmataceae bacterium]|jgi:hypothetical protein
MQTSARFPDDDPQKAGHVPNEQAGTPPGDDRPDPSWSLERLASYAKDEVTCSFHAEQEAVLQAHKSAVHLFRAGHALALARAKCKGEQHGDWKKFKKKHALADTTANDAIRLYENAKTEDALAGLGITEAKVKFGVTRPRNVKTPPPPKSPPQAGAGPGADSQPGNAEGATDKNNAESAVTKESGRSAPSGSDGAGTSEKADKGGAPGDGETDSADEQADTLAKELEEIAQRLSEINQDTFGKVHWTKAKIRKAMIAVAAVKQSAMGIHRRLRNEEPDA